MNWKSHTAYIVAFAIVLSCALIAARQWAEHVRDDAKRDAVIEQSKHIDQAAQDERLRLQNQIAEGRKVANANVVELEKQLADIRRDHAAAKREIEAVTGPANMQTLDDAPRDSSPGHPLPDAPSASKGITLTEDQQEKLAEKLNLCKQTEVENDTCALESSLKSELLAQADAQIKAAKDATTAALKSSKGGAWYQRTWRVIKPIGCGGAGAGVGALAAGPKGAIIGSVAAGVGCAIFGK
jgi:hypothetical protein